jgi:beta-hydroxylase
MFMDTSRFAFTEPLERHTADFQADLARLQRQDFVHWPIASSYSGTWLIFPLLMFGDAPGADVDLAVNQSRCATTMRILGEVGRVTTALFSWLDPGTHIYPHHDAYFHRMIRAHLGLRVPEGCPLRSGAETRSYADARLVIIDGQVEHETANLSSQARVTLLLDVRMTDEEEDYVASVSPVRKRIVDEFRRTGTVTGVCSPKY